MPGLLLLLAADVLLPGPTRALAWRLLHDPEVQRAPALLGLFLPTAAPFDRDPLAALLGGGAATLAALYLAASLAGARARVRGSILGVAFALAVGLPTLLYVSVGAVSGRPFGQDGGVVQLPLAMDRLLAGQSPYGADYSDSMLGKQSRASSFWRAYGGNPIVRHHAYLPGTHLVMLLPHLGARAVGVRFDPRVVTLLALVVAAALAAACFADAARRLTAAALFLVNPLVYWQQAFGANDALFVALLLGSAALLARRRPTAAGVLLGLACATKQLAWPFAPFLLLHASGARGFLDLARPAAWARLRGPALAAALTFALVLAPVMALDLRAFYADIVSYNMGLGGDAYPFGGTPGIGFANLLIYTGVVRSLRDAFPFGLFYLLLAPLALLLARAQMRRPGLGSALVAGSVLLLAVLYFSRVVHANYLIAAVTLLPLGALLGGATADVPLACLSLLGLGTAFVDRGLLRLAWEDAVRAAPLPASGLAGALLPRIPPGLTDDPLGLAVSALATGLGLTYAIAGALGASRRARAALVVLAILATTALPAWTLAAVGRRAGTTRAQDAFAVPAAAPGREMLSSSFRLEPPGELTGRSPLGRADGRLLTLLALAVAMAGVWGGVGGKACPLSLAALGLLPVVPLGLVLGAPDLLWLAPIVLAARAAIRGRSVGGWMLGGAVLALGLSTSLGGDAGPGVGILGVAGYFGLESSLAIHLSLACAPVAAAAYPAWLLLRRPEPARALAGSALMLLVVAVLARSAAVSALTPAIVLLALTALAPGARGGADDAPVFC